MIEPFPLRMAAACAGFAVVIGFLIAIGGMSYVLAPLCAVVLFVAGRAILRDLSDIPEGSGPYGGWPEAEIGRAPTDNEDLPGGDDNGQPPNRFASTTGQVLLSRHA